MIPSAKTIQIYLPKGNPSGASSLVSGRSTNGWIEWKNEAGKTLDSVYR
ncbi:MAG TPA: hypothetical protein DCP60_01205 [Psychrobacter sp.]|jgi:hypothetical protein|nr:hypothetical protein [Psychrobacter sp.]|tara:strand:- start:215 stop:361 length:147 start_codon:yes stop_codon:yes gene_type:complete